MSNHQKTLTKKQKIIFYTSATSLAVLAAAIAVLILIFAITRPSDEGFNNNKNAMYLTSSNSSGFVANGNYSDSSKSKAPKITGIQNGTVYYTTQYVVVQDTNLVSVTLNGDDVEKEFYIDGNETNMYVIEAVDSDYNTTTYTVYTKPINSLLDDIRHLNTYTVTSDFYEAISNVKNTAIKAETSYSMSEEIEELNEVINTADRLLKRLDDVHNRITSITKSIDSCQKNGNYNNVNKIITDIDALLSTDNLTQSERSSLQRMRSKCQSWLSQEH